MGKLPPPAGTLRPMTRAQSSGKGTQWSSAHLAEHLCPPICGCCQSPRAQPALAGCQKAVLRGSGQPPPPRGEVAARETLSVPSPRLRF